MDDETLSRVFEPFFTTKQLGVAPGWDLRRVRHREATRRLIEVQSATGAGTVFKVYLPRIEEGATGDDDARCARPRPAAKETVLVVEDDVLVRDLTMRRLSACGYNVLVAQAAPGMAWSASTVGQSTSCHGRSHARHERSAALCRAQQGPARAPRVVHVWIPATRLPSMAVCSTKGSFRQKPSRSPI